MRNQTVPCCEENLIHPDKVDQVRGLLPADETWTRTQNEFH